MKYDGETPVIRAIKFENFEAVKFLLTVEDVDVNEPDSFGQSLAELAVMKNCEELVESMLNIERLDWNTTNPDGDTPAITGIEKN